MTKDRVKYLHLGLVTILLFSIVYSFVQVFYDGFDYTDPFYFTSLYAYDGFIDSFHLLNQGLFILTSKLFGGYLISYKIVVWAFYALGMISCLWYWYNKTEKKTLLYLGTIIGFLCLPNATWEFAFNGNSMSILGVVLMLIALDNFIKGEKRSLIWIGALMAFLPLVRFPNIVALVIVLFVAPFICSKWKDYGRMVLSLLGGIVLYILINCIVFGGPVDFINAIQGGFIKASDTTAADHSISYLMKEYLHSLKDGVSYYKLLFLLVIVPCLGYFTRKKIYSWMLALVTILGFLAVIMMKVNPSSWFFPWFVSCTLMMMSVIICVFAVIRGDKQLFGWGLLPIGLGLCCCAGSATGLTLFWSPICAMAPFILLKMNYVLESTNKNEIIWAIISFLGIAICSFLYCRVDTMILGVIGLILLIIFVYIFSKKKTFSIDRLDFDMRNAYIPFNATLVTIILCSSFLLIVACWIDRRRRPLYTYVYPINEPKLIGIHTPQELKIWIEDVMLEYRQLDDSQNVVFYGFVANIFPYLANILPIQGVDFSWHENERNIQAFITATEVNPVVFICPNNPECLLYNFDSYPKINGYLLDKGYKRELHKYYAIYFPPNDTIE